MSRLATFFQGAEKGVGGFYPSQHIVAVYATEADAAAAKKALDSQLHAQGESICVTGREVLEFAAEHVAHQGLIGGLMRELSSLIGTEEQYVEQDLEAAQRGAAFLAVYCLDEVTKAKIWEVLSSTHPIAARYYSPGGIEHLLLRAHA